MKNLFDWYYRPTAEEFRQMWESGTFVFDTNVLLNLYRYPAQLRDVFFSVMGKISERTWVPYQVGLEFQRNKFNRIKIENSKVDSIISEIKRDGARIVENVKKLTNNNINAGLKLENLNDFIEKFEDSHKEIIAAVSAAMENLPKNNLDDPIGIQVLNLFNGKVGNPPAGQEQLDAMLVDANSRFEKKIPPGFKDNNPKDDSCFYDGDICYQNKYGDLILWKQTIEYAKANKVKKLIFVTDDSKSDWWDGDGHLTRGPLPALLKEMRVKGEVDLFWIYKSDQFLRYAEEYLQAHEVTEEAIEQAKDISEISAAEMDQEESPVIRKNPSSSSISGDNIEFLMPSRDEERWKEVQSRVFQAEHAVREWLENKFPGEVLVNNQFPDFIVNTERGRIGFEVRLLSKKNIFLQGRRLREMSGRIINEISRNNIQNFVVVFVLGSDITGAFRIEVFNSILKIIKGIPVDSVVMGSIDNGKFSEEININNEIKY